MVLIVTKRKKKHLTGSQQDFEGHKVNQRDDGIPAMLCGDFRQILPVIRFGTRANIIIFEKK